jgi:fermentation-respiration switch protein FrsA (DUF1100 family)
MIGDRKVIFMKILATICLAGIGFVVYVRFLEAATVFLPARRLMALPSDVGMIYEDVFLNTQDGVLIHGWFIPAPKPALSQGAPPTLIYLHGNAGNVGDRLDKLEMFHAMRVNVLIIDYRGYGRSQGRPTEEGLYLDAQAAFDHLMTRRNIDPAKIIVYGGSLGGAAAVDLAARRPVSALILDSTFTSAADMAKVILPIVPAFLLKIRLDSLNKIRNIRIPKLIVHSRDDETIPFVLGRKLYEAASLPKDFLEISGLHNEGYLLSRPVYTAGIEQFIRSVYDGS